jgi:hypothetical protein
MFDFPIERPCDDAELESVLLGVKPYLYTLERTAFFLQSSDRFGGRTLLTADAYPGNPVRTELGYPCVVMGMLPSDELENALKFTREQFPDHDVERLPKKYLQFFKYFKA